MISVDLFQPADADAWAAFLANSDNGTLFHDLRFLSYHPTDRFKFNHLVLRSESRIVALLPGAMTGPEDQLVFTSPAGASVGGLAVAPGLGLAAATEMTAALQTFARDLGWRGIDVTLGPQAYSRSCGDLLGFAMFCAGFRLIHRWLCYVIEIPSAHDNGFERRFRKTYANMVRAARRDQIEVTECGIEAIDDFLSVFAETYRRHGVDPTHSPTEIGRLFELLPDRMRFVIARKGGETLAGLMVMQINDAAAYTFYICRRTADANSGAVVVALAELIERLGERGVRFLDTGPASRDGNLNPGVAFFKEGLGAVGQCRDQWSWRIDER